MDVSAFEERLNELLKEVNNLPEANNKKLLLIAKKAKLCNKKLRENVEGLHESLDHLRLIVKYLVFDLEATRRENMYLRKMLKEQEE